MTKGLINMKKFYYYAELNDNDVCIRIVSSTNKIVGSSKHIEIPEYNETVRYKKWLGDQWSPESYEPDVDTVIQDEINQLKESNGILIRENLELKLALADLAETYETKLTELQLALAELAERGE
ncbi:MAG: hypothetical protein GX053_12345 [Tissierella sp.]|nr:hypothetical protein [Tissierella sp.]